MLQFRSTCRWPLGAAVLPLFLLAGCAGEDGAAANATGGAAGEQDNSFGAATASFPEDFGTIQTVRELADGRVLVADPLGGALYTVDMDAGTRTQIGTEGQGPGEYRQPDAVWALPGDSSLVVDLGNGRMIAVGPDLSFGGTTPLSAGDPRSGMVIAIPQAVDGSGRVYARSMGGGPSGEMPDSGAVLRVARATFTVDTVARFKLEDRTVTRSGSANNQSVNVSPVPLSPQDTWGVARDGSVVIARSNDYHIEWIAPNGTLTRGEPRPFDAIPINQAKKEEWARVQGQSGGGIGISVNVQNGAVQMNFSRGGRSDPDLTQYTWPEVAPPFYDGRILVDMSDRAWVRRHVRAGRPTTYDVFDRSARYVTTMTLPRNKRLIGFGNGTAYVVAYDEFDLNYLERYAMPSM